jgi:hypothetical protein
MDLLTTYTHDLELQALTTLSLNSAAHDKPFSAGCVFTSRSLVTASNSEDSSASRVQVLSSQSPVQNSTELSSKFEASLRPTVSWNKAPNCQTIAGFLMWGSLSDERTGLSFARVTVSSNKSVVSMYN